MLDESVKSDLEKTVLEWQGWSVADLAKRTLAYIEQLEKLVPQWISVEETLPEKGDNVLISLCGCNVKQAVYRGDGVSNCWPLSLSVMVYLRRHTQTPIIPRIWDLSS